RLGGVVLAARRGPRLPRPPGWCPSRGRPETGVAGMRLIRGKLTLLALFACVAAACGTSVMVQTAAENPAANRAALQKEAKQEQQSAKNALSKGGVVKVGTTGSSATTGGTTGGTT